MRIYKIGIADKLIPGKDGIVRAVKLRAGKSSLKRSIQFLYPMELHVDAKDSEPKKLKPDVRESVSKRRAAIEATLRMKEFEEDSD